MREFFPGIDPIAEMRGYTSETETDADESAAARFVLPEARILLVDDIKTNLLATASFLNEYECSIDTCTSGFDAVHMVQHKYYDMVFMDYMMPRMNGTKTMQRIRALEGGYWELPIIALTANVSQGAREMLLSDGFNDYLSKPIEISGLSKILQRWIPKEKLLHNLVPVGPKEPSFFAYGGLKVEGIDIHAGRARYGEKTYLDVLHSYLSHTPALLQKLHRWNELKDYLPAIHGLRGSSYGICADGLGKQAAVLEHAIEIGDTRLVEANNFTLIFDAEKLLQDLEAFLKALEHRTDAKPMAKEPCPVLLRQLADLSRQYRSTAIEEVLDKLEAFRYENDGNILVNWLRKQATSLEYKAIWECLKDRQSEEAK